MNYLSDQLRERVLLAQAGKPETKKITLTEFNKIKFIIYIITMTIIILLSFLIFYDVIKI